MTRGYEAIRIDAESLRELPLDSIPEGVFPVVQRCWAGKPYMGPLHTLELVGAFETQGRDYYLAYEPSGITDVQILFLIRRGDEKPIAAFQRSTL